MPNNTFVHLIVLGSLLLSACSKLPIAETDVCGGSNPCPTVTSTTVIVPPLTPTITPTPTETTAPTETPVPTEVPGAMTVENIQNFKDIEKCPVVESPFEDYDKFMGQWREYLNIVHEQILPDWQKSVITFNGDGSTGISATILVIRPPNTIDYIGGVCFDYKDDKARIVSFVAKKENLDDAIISVLINPEMENNPYSVRTVDDFIALDGVKPSNFQRFELYHSKPDLGDSVYYTPFSNLYWPLQNEAFENILNFIAGRANYNEEIFLLGRLILKK